MIKTKKWGAGLLTLAFTAALCTGGSAAAERTLVPVGRAVGIQMDMEGVQVVDLIPLATEKGSLSPAGDAGVMPGDWIVRLGSREIGSGEDLLGAIEKLSGDPVSLTVHRGDKTIQFTVSPTSVGEGVWRLGLCLRDSVAGIGTVTFYDPETGLYGALGHGVSGIGSGELAPLSGGSITDARVLDVRAGAKGSPGELYGAPNAESVLGAIAHNTVHGIFGHADASLSKREALAVADESELHPGPAIILATVSGDGPCEYAVEITRVYRGGGDRSMMLTVTDPELLNVTGGIVQGMSGSPIIQNGKLTGAVTHVLVNDPTQGYGISIAHMLESAEAASALDPAA
jgi:stage IV sporulation protein B